MTTRSNGDNAGPAASGECQYKLADLAQRIDALGRYL